MGSGERRFEVEVGKADPKKASEETTELKRMLRGGTRQVLRGGQKTRDGRRWRCLAPAGRHPCHRSGQSRVREEKRRGRPLFTDDRVVIGGVGGGEVDGAEGAGSFNELSLSARCH